MWPGSIPPRIKRSRARSLATLIENKGTSLEPIGEMNAIPISMAVVLHNGHCDYKVSLIVSQHLDLNTGTLAFGDSKCFSTEISFIRLCVLISKLFCL